MTNEPSDELIITDNYINNNMVELHNITITEVQNDIIECPICLENIEQIDGILIMECCNKKIHLECLINWYSKHRKNLICIMCNQTNNFCNNLIYIDDEILISESNNSSTRSNNSSTRSNNSPTRSNNLSIQLNYFIHKYFKHIIICVIIISTILLVITIIFAVFII